MNEPIKQKSATELIEERNHNKAVRQETLARITKMLNVGAETAKRWRSEAQGFGTKKLRIRELANCHLTLVTSLKTAIINHHNALCDCEQLKIINAQLRAIIADKDREIEQLKGGK